MLYNLNFLKKGAIFPPESEIKRLDAYKINKMLLDDECWSALPEYKKRVLYILSNFSLEIPNVYLYNSNYWSDVVKKFQELTFGEKPEINTIQEYKELFEIYEKTGFFQKCKSGCEDFIALGDWVTKIIETESGNDFLNVDPATWYPVVAEENVKEIKYHVFAWISKVDGDKYELRVQIHEKGKYTNRAFKISNYNNESYYVVHSTKQKIYCPTYEIGDEILIQLNENASFKLGTFQTGLDDFAVVFSANNESTRKINGTSDFDNVTDAIMEYNVRMTLKNVVLDKHSAPKMYGPQIVGDGSVGNYLEVLQGETAPGYLVWDASMQSVENTLVALKDDISNLSGLGSLLSSKTFGESQGYDALMIKLSPAIMRSAGKKVVLERHLKKLISLLSKKDGKEISTKDISITWHDGIPITESAKADIAQKHLSTGWSYKRVLINDYGFDEKTAEEIIEEKRLETPVIPTFGINDEEDTDEEEF